MLSKNKAFSEWSLKLKNPLKRTRITCVQNVSHLDRNFWLQKHRFDGESWKIITRSTSIIHHLPYLVIPRHLVVANLPEINIGTIYCHQWFRDTIPLTYTTSPLIWETFTRTRCGWVSSRVGRSNRQWFKFFNIRTIYCHQ